MRFRGAVMVWQQVVMEPPTVDYSRNPTWRPKTAMYHRINAPVACDARADRKLQFYVPPPRPMSAPPRPHTGGHEIMAYGRGPPVMEQHTVAAASNALHYMSITSIPNGARPLSDYHTVTFSKVTADHPSRGSPISPPGDADSLPRRVVHAGASSAKVGAAACWQARRQAIWRSRGPEPWSGRQPYLLPA